MLKKSLRGLVIAWLQQVYNVYSKHQSNIYYYVSLRCEFPVVMSVAIFPAYKICSVCIYLELFIGWFTSCLHYLCLLTNSGAQYILCCVFDLVFFVLCTICCQFLWIVNFLLPHWCSNVYLPKRKIPLLVTTK